MNYLKKGLPFLAECLSLHFKTKETGKCVVILLVDEFCPFVKKALIMPYCAMGSILSLGANNIQQRHFLDSHSYSESVGFTEQEVKLLVDEDTQSVLKNV